MKSRYSTKTISSRYYQTLPLSGNTIGTNGGLNQGYIFVPYIMVDKTPLILDREFLRKILREERIEKLEKLKTISKI